MAALSWLITGYLIGDLLYATLDEELTHTYKYSPCFIKIIFEWRRQSMFK